MTSKREDILSYITSSVVTEALVGAPVYRSRVAAIARSEGTTVLIEPVSDSAAYGVIDFVEWSLQIRVSVITRGPVPDQLADDVNAAIYAALMADRNLGGRVKDVQPIKTDFQMLDGDNPVGISDNFYLISYRSAASTLT